jgi:hypothetical protein
MTTFTGIGERRAREILATGGGMPGETYTIDDARASLERIAYNRAFDMFCECEETALHVYYANHKSERRIRHLEPLSMRFGTTEWHPIPDTLIKCRDLETGEIREFSTAFDGNPGLPGVIRLALENAARRGPGLYAMDNGKEWGWMLAEFDGEKWSSHRNGYDIEPPTEMIAAAVFVSTPREYDRVPE